MSEYEKDITMNSTPSYATTQEDIIDLIDSYWVSRYRDGDNDKLGFLKPFYNVVINPTEVASKMIDVDTKDIKVIAEDGASYYPVWFFTKELRDWMKEKNFGKLLNEIIYQLPKYGTVVLKKSGEDVNIVPLQNLLNNPIVRQLDDDLIIEEHIETRQQFRKRKWGKEAIQKAIDDLDVNDREVVYYEAYGDFENEEKNYFIYSETGVELFSAKLDECPYREVHWDKLEGRWLGRGVVEKLFEAQIHLNKVTNMKSQSLHWTSKRIFQTRDDTVEKNLMVDIQNGDIMRINSEITPVANEERNIHAYKEEEDSWGMLIDRLGFSYDIIRGQKPTAGTTLGQTQIQTAMASGFFDLKQEDVGLFLRDLILDWLIPMFEKEKKSKHQVMISSFSDEELAHLRELIIEEKANKAIMEYITKSGNIPTQGEVDAIKIVVGEKTKKEKAIDIPEGFYKNLKYKIDVVITGEQIDLASKVTGAQVAMQILGSNPTILQDPKTKNLFMQLMNWMGLNPLTIKEEETPESLMTQNVAQMGGSIAKPPAVSSAMTTVPTAKTL
jgi:hypothetical protein